MLRADCLPNAFLKKRTGCCIQIGDAASAPSVQQTFHLEQLRSLSTLTIAIVYKLFIHLDGPPGQMTVAGINDPAYRSDR